MKQPGLSIFIKCNNILTTIRAFNLKKGPYSTCQPYECPTKTAKDENLQYFLHLAQTRQVVIFPKRGIVTDEPFVECSLRMEGGKQCFLAGCVNTTIIIPRV